MATSGSADYTRTAAQLISSMYRALGVVPQGVAVTNNQNTSGLEALNLVKASWAAHGLLLWKRRDIHVFLINDRKYYDLGPSGDHAAINPVVTELAADAASGAASITVDSITGITNTYALGIELDSGAIQWTTVSGVPAGTTVVPAAVLTGAASTDNKVFCYQAKPHRPLDIEPVGAFFRDKDDADREIELIALNDYRNLPDKTSAGDCLQVAYEPLLTNGRLHVWPACDDASGRIVVPARMPVEDFDATTNDADFPAEILQALKWNGAMELSTETSGVDPRTLQTVERRANESLAIIMASHMEAASVIFVADGGW